MGRERIRLDDLRFSEEVIPEWERSLSVRFARDAFAHAATVRAVLALVRRQTRVHGRPEHAPHCTSLRLFHRLRRALRARGISPAGLTPHTPLAALFPWRTRARQWEQFRRESGLPLPALRLPAAAFAGVWLGVTASTWGLFPGPAGVQAVLCGLGFALAAGDRALAKVAFPVATLGELTRHVLDRHYHEVRGGPFHWREVRLIVFAGLLRCHEEKGDVWPGELTNQTRLEW